MNQYETKGLRKILDDLSTDQLKQMLDEELQKENSDPASVKLLLAVLEERHAEEPKSVSSVSEEARQRYQEQMEKLFPPEPKKAWKPLLKVASVLLVCVVLFSPLLPQKAEAESFWEMLQRWSNTVIEFFGREDSFVDPEYVFTTENSGLQQVYEAVVELAIAEPVVPMWLPDGYELVELDSWNTPVTNGIWAVFSLNGNEIFYQVNVYNGEPAHQYYRDDSHYESYELEGATYNITRNNDRWSVIWAKDNIECHITLDCQEDTLRSILKSIYVMEE